MSSATWRRSIVLVSAIVLAACGRQESSENGSVAMDVTDSTSHSGLIACTGTNGTFRTQCALREQDKEIIEKQNISAEITVEWDLSACTSLPRASALEIYEDGSQGGFKLVLGQAGVHKFQAVKERLLLRDTNAAHTASWLVRSACALTIKARPSPSHDQMTIWEKELDLIEVKIEMHSEIYALKSRFKTWYDAYVQAPEDSAEQQMAKTFLEDERTAAHDKWIASGKRDKPAESKWTAIDSIFARASELEVMQPVTESFDKLAGLRDELVALEKIIKPWRDEYEARFKVRFSDIRAEVDGALGQ